MVDLERGERLDQVERPVPQDRLVLLELVVSLV